MSVPIARTSAPALCEQTQHDLLFHPPRCENPLRVLMSGAVHARPFLISPRILVG